MSKERLSQLLGANDGVAIQLGSEKDVEELWNAGHEDKYQFRQVPKSKYPVDDWFGVIVNDNGIPKLVSTIGYSLQDGKNNKKFAFVGGAKNHRFGLFDAIMLKDNHLKAFGGINKIKNIKFLKKGDFLEIEIEKLSQIKAALKSKPDIYYWII